MNVIENILLTESALSLERAEPVFQIENFTSEENVELLNEFSCKCLSDSSKEFEYSKDCKFKTKSLKFIADLLKDENIRMGLNRDKILKLISDDVMIFNQFPIEYKIQWFRIIGNLCVEDEQICEKAFKSIGHKFFVSEALNCISKEIFNLFDIVCGSLFNLILTSGNCNEFIESNGLEIVREITKAKRYENLKFPFMILELVLESEVSCHDYYTKETVLSFIELISNAPGNVSVSFVVGLFISQTFEKLFGDSELSFDLFVALVVHLHKYHTSKTIDESSETLSLGRAVAVLSGFEIFLRSPLPNDQINTFLSWLSADNEALLTCAALSLGNFSRNETNSSQLLLEFDILTSLLPLLSDKNSINVLHSVTGCIRNLCVAEKTKDLIVKLSLAEISSDLLCSTSIDVIQMNLIVIIRHLCSKNQQLVMKLCNLSFYSGIKLPARLIQISAESEVEAVKSESRRLYLLLLRTCPEVHEESFIFSDTVLVLQDFIKSKHSQLKVEALATILALKDTKWYNELKELLKELEHLEDPNIKTLLKQ